MLVVAKLSVKYLHLFFKLFFFCYLLLSGDLSGQEYSA